MKAQLIVHADDFGLTREITDGILRACDEGVLNSLSLLPNGLAFDYAVKEIKKRPHIRVAVHLNFLEGCSVANVKTVDCLVNKKGRFCYSFLGLWIKYVQSSPKIKKLMKEQIKNEIKAQIKKVTDSGGFDSVNVDSHNHYHLIPFIFEALLEIAGELRISYVRVPEESFFWCLRDKNSFNAYLGLNFVKHCLVNGLSQGIKEKLDERSIKYPRNFVGLLFTGCMSEKAVFCALRSLKSEPSHGVVEILFHPGRAREDELRDWTSEKRFKDYYCSERRDRELKELLSPSFKNLIKSASL